VKLICANCGKARPTRDRVVFRGPIFDAAVPEEEFRAARIFAYPSLAARGETFGLRRRSDGRTVALCLFPISDVFAILFCRMKRFCFRRNAPDPADSLVVAFRTPCPIQFGLERIARAGQLNLRNFPAPALLTSF